MPKTTPIDHAVLLNMALIGYQNEMTRIEATMNAIRAELGQKSTRTFATTPTASAEPKTTGRKKFSKAARLRMSAAQKKRHAALRLAKAEAAKPKRKPTAKRRVPVKAATKVAPKPTAKKAATKVRKAAAKPAVPTPVAAVQAAEPKPTEATA